MSPADNLFDPFGNNDDEVGRHLQVRLVGPAGVLNRRSGHDPAQPNGRVDALRADPTARIEVDRGDLLVIRVDTRNGAVLRRPVRVDPGFILQDREARRGALLGLVLLGVASHRELAARKAVLGFVETEESGLLKRAGQVLIVASSEPNELIDRNVLLRDEPGPVRQIGGIDHNRGQVDPIGIGRAGVAASSCTTAGEAACPESWTDPKTEISSRTAIKENSGRTWIRDVRVMKAPRRWGHLHKWRAQMFPGGDRFEGGRCAQDGGVVSRPAHDLETDRQCRRRTHRAPSRPVGRSG